MPLRPFRSIPKDLREWTRWMKGQDAGTGEPDLGLPDETGYILFSDRDYNRYWGAPTIRVQDEGVNIAVPDPHTLNFTGALVNAATVPYIDNDGLADYGRAEIQVSGSFYDLDDVENTPTQDPDTATIAIFYWHAGNWEVVDLVETLGMLRAVEDEEITGTWTFANNMFFESGAEIDMNGGSLVQPVISGAGYEHTDYGPSGTTQTISWLAGQSCEVDLAATTGNITITIDDSPSDAGYAEFTVRIIQDTTTHRTVSWNSAVKWAGGTAPTITASDGAIDVFKFCTTDGGTNWYGWIVAQDLQ